MKIKRTGAQEGTIEEFAECYGLTMEIFIAGYSGDHTSHFSGTRVKGSGYSTDVLGFGSTDCEAIADYANKINGKILVFIDDGRELQVWRLI